MKSFAAALGCVLLPALGAMTAACGGPTEYAVLIQFNSSATQDSFDAVAEILRGYDEDLDFSILELFEPVARVFLETDAPDFCLTVEPELDAMTNVADVTCSRA